MKYDVIRERVERELFEVEANSEKQAIQILNKHSESYKMTYVDKGIVTYIRRMPDIGRSVLKEKNNDNKENSL